MTAPTPEETLENLDFAIACGADAAVLAPLSIQGVDDPVRFVARDISDLLDARPRRIPVYLYDNADIAVDPRVLHIRTRQVKAMSRLDFVRGIITIEMNSATDNPIVFSDRREIISAGNFHGEYPAKGRKTYAAADRYRSLGYYDFCC